MGELLTALVVAAFYTSLALGALIITEGLMALEGWYKERRQRLRLERFRRP